MSTPEPNLGAREFVLEICNRMLVGWHELFVADLVRDGWPATGDQDDRLTSIAGVTFGEFASLAAAYAGNRPIGGETSLESMQASLGDEFEVKHRPEQCAFEVHRVRDRKAKPAILARVDKLPNANSGPDRRD